jgi:hypothetical protein
MRLIETVLIVGYILLYSLVIASAILILIGVGKLVCPS